MKFSLTLCKAKEPIQKTLHVHKNTGKLKKVPPAHFPSQFEAKIKTVTFEGLARILDEATPFTFLIHGVPPRKEVRVVTKSKKESTYKNKANVIARTPEFFKYPTGKPGLFMIDVDEEGYEVADILSLLEDIFPEFARAGYACCQSSSSNIKTKRRQLSGQKWHLYFVAKEGQDIERFGKVLFERAVLSGYGHIFISADGKQHIRTFFDRSVIAPSRIDFIAPPNVKPPAYRENIPAEAARGTFIDTLLLKDLSQKEQRQFNQIAKDLKDETSDQAAAVKEKHLKEKVEEYVERTGADYKTAKAVVAARYVDEEEVRLHFDDLITFEDGDKETVHVRDIVDSPDVYVGRAVRDPLEPDYGENKAKIYLSSGRLLINSFVHGGRKFILSGNMTHEYDTDNNERLLGFRLDANAINGGWAEKMLKTWVKVNDGGKIKYAQLISETDRFVPVPEKGAGPSGLFELEPLLLLDEKNFCQAMPKVKVVTGWDPVENAPKEELLAHAFLALPNITYKKGGITMAEPSPQVDNLFLNLWFGFPVKPKRGGVHKIVDRYFEEFIDYESEEVYEYFWSYIYHMFQRPFEKPGVAILFQSTQGTGKGTFIQLLSSLIGPVHSGFVDKMESLTGRFNSIIAGKLLVYADEIMFGGYHGANNTLKKIITDEYLTVEAKYQAPRRIANVSRLFFSTNEQWALNVERGDRRLFVPRVSTAFQQDIDFFTELRYQWNRCYESVMHRFLNMPINTEISSPPMTKDKMELIDVSMSSAESMFKEILTGGILENHGVDFADDVIPFNHNRPTEIPTDTLYAIYRAYHRRFFARQGEPLDKVIFWKETFSFFGGRDKSGIIQKGRIGTAKRRVIFPSVERMRLLWDESHGSHDFDDKPDMKLVESGE